MIESQVPTEGVENEEGRIQTFLIFSLGGGIYGITIDIIREIVSIRKTIPIPHAPSFLTGIFHLRDEIVHVIDIYRIITLKQDDTAKPKLLIIYPDITDGICYGISVDEVYGVAWVPTRKITIINDQSGRVDKNFMFGTFFVSLENIRRTDKRKKKDRFLEDDEVIWVDLEEMLLEITRNEEGESTLIFRLIALFDPEQILSGAYVPQQIQR